ncbi:MAG: PDZ domain-containing protein [Candidatus Eisenbacteria bacterium]|nr:PDZ domain-containing protein [Candidatus Eisenbacteria bacterium]
MRMIHKVLAIVSLLPLFAVAGASAEEGGPYLGVRAQRLTAPLADALGVEGTSGVLVSEVAEGSPAAEADLQRGDVLLTWNGEAIPSPRALIRMVRDAEIGDEIAFTLIRRGESRTTRVELAEREKKGGVDKGKRGRGERNLEKRSHHRTRIGAWLGVETRDLDADLAAYFDLPAGSGALVVGVPAEGPAARAGVKGGDVIVRLGDDAVQSAADLAEAVAGREAGDEVEVEIVRKGKKTTLRVTLGAPTSPFERFRTMRFPPPDWGRFHGMRGRIDREMDHLKKEVGKLRKEIDKIRDDK